LVSDQPEIVSVISLINMITKSIKKNLPELKAFLSLSMPQFVYRIRRFKDIPVFCFHSAHYEQLKKILEFLKENRYQTLNSEELAQRLHDPNYKNNGRDIVLTFDDGMGTVWSVAMPLLEEYRQKIVLFVLPGLTPEGKPGKTVADNLDEDNRELVLNRDYLGEPLCNWSELEAMHKSGLVDIQSHGMYHMLVSTSNRIVEFIHPDFNTNLYGNIHIPGYNIKGDSNGLCRDFVLGHPVYESAPRLRGVPRYKDKTELRLMCAEHVAKNGGKGFFSNNHWREELNALVAEIVPSDQFESEEEVEREMRFELTESKRMLEDRLGKAVSHFCFPWFDYCPKSAELAKQAGYETLHVGLEDKTSGLSKDRYPTLIKRMQEEYTLNLPGKGGISLLGVFKQKLNKKGAAL